MNEEAYRNYLRGCTSANPADTDPEGKDSGWYKFGRVCSIADALLSWGGLIALIILGVKLVKRILHK